MKNFKIFISFLMIAVLIGFFYILFFEQTILPFEIARLNLFFQKRKLVQSDVHILNKIAKSMPQGTLRIEEALKAYNLRIVRKDEIDPNYVKWTLYVIKDFDRNGILDIALSCFHEKKREAFVLIVLNNSVLLEKLYTKYGLPLYEIKKEFIDNFWLDRSGVYGAIEWDWKPYWPSNPGSLRPCFGVIYNYSSAVEYYWDGRQFLKLLAAGP